MAQLLLTGPCASLQPGLLACGKGECGNRLMEEPQSAVDESAPGIRGIPQESSRAAVVCLKNGKST